MLKPQRTQGSQRKNSTGCRPRSHYDILPNHAEAPIPPPSSFRKICEQIIKHHFGLNHVSLRIVGKTCRRNESEEYALLYGTDITKGLYFVREFCSVLLAYLKRLVRKLHFTDIDHIVCPVDNKVDLRPTLAIAARTMIPGIFMGQYARHSQRELDLPDMKEAKPFKSQPTPCSYRAPRGRMKPETSLIYHISALGTSMQERISCVGVRF